MSSDRTLDSSELLNNLRNDIWLIGMAAWLFGIGDRFTAAFVNGEFTAIEALQFCVAVFFAFCWFSLKPESFPAISSNHCDYTSHPIHQIPSDESTVGERIANATQTCLFLVLTVIPFSLFLISVAMGQPEAQGFFLWALLACLVGGLPFLFATLNQDIRAQLLAARTEDEFTWIDPEWQAKATPTYFAPMPAYADHQDSVWRGWNVHHAYVPNPDSQVPVILVHGFGGSTGHWRQNMAELAQHHSVYALDLLGFGASDKPDTDYSIQLWVDQVYDFWRTVVKTPAILVGNSIGSLTCLATAAEHPEMVRGIAMISLPDTATSEAAVPALMRPVMHSVRSLLTSPWVLQPLFHLVRQRWIVRHWASMAYACKEAVTDELLEILTRPAQEKGSAIAFCAILKAMLNARFSPNVPAILSQMKIPSLLVWGKQDRMIPPALARQFLRYNSELQFLELDNAGHCAHDECPDRVNRELLSWIQTQVIAQHA